MSDKTPVERREKCNQYISRGDYVVVAEVESVCIKGYHIPFFEPAVLRFLDEVTSRLEQQGWDYLRTVGQIYRDINAKVPEPAHA